MSAKTLAPRSRFGLTGGRTGIGKLLIVLTVMGYGFTLLVNLQCLVFRVTDLFPQIITAGLGLVTELAGGYCIGRATTPKGKAYSEVAESRQFHYFPAPCASRGRVSGNRTTAR